VKQLFIFLLITLSLNSLSQNPLYRRFFSADFSITGAIYDVYQDKKGFIWLGTDAGLIRFDGKNSLSFPSSKKFSRGVTNIFEDKSGQIYCQSFSGQFFKTMALEDSITFIPEISNYGNIKQASVINDSLIAFADKQSLGFYNPKTKQFWKNKINYNEFQPSTSKQKNNNYTIILPEEHQLVYHYPNKASVSKTFISNNVVFYHIKLKNNDLIVGKKPPYILENIDAKKTIELKELHPSILINHVAVIDEQHIAFLTSNGVYIYNEDFEFKRHYFAKESISSFVKDQQGNYWYGTLNNGLILVSQPQTYCFLNNLKFTSIAFKNNSVLAGTSENEIHELNLENKTTHLVYKDSTIHEVRKIYYNNIQDELLFSNQQLNIIKNKTHQKIIRSINDIKQVNRGTYLLSEGASVSLYPVTTFDTLYSWYNPRNMVYKDNRLALSKNNIRVKSSVMMQNNCIISATSNGLLLFKKNKQEEELFYKYEKIKAISLAKINDDSLLIATSKDGVLLYHKNIIEEFINPKDFSYSDIYMLKIFDRKIAVVTYKSFDVFDFNRKKILSQYISDGYHGCDLVDFIVKGSHSYIANIYGVIISPLYNYKKNDTEPLVHITKTNINGSSVNFSGIKELEYNSYYFDFLFSIIDYRGLETTKAYYKVNDGEWILTTENRILLTALEPNTYKIQLKAINERGFETINPAIISFVIKPPFYKAWWFIISIFGGITTIIFIFFKYRLHNIKKQNQILTEKIELESALQKSTLTGIKAQMNPHFIFNALNTIQSYIYLNDKKAAGDYLVSFSELTRYILDMSNRERIPLSDEIKALNLYLKLEKMRFEEDFNYEINTDNITSDTTMIPSMLIQPYVENAVKHGLLHKKGLKNVQVVFGQDKNSLIIEIIDNGIGIEASTKINTIRNKKHKSFASEANKKRLEILNANAKDNIGIETITLKNEQQQTVGTKVIIKIPII